MQMVRVLGMSPAMMGYQSLLGSFIALFGSRMWGRAMDRVGDRAVLLATGAIICTHVWVWMLAWPGFLWPIWIATVLSGFSWSGFNLAIFAWPQRMCSRENRQYTYGLLGFISGPAFVLGSLFGGFLTTWLPLSLFHIGSFEVTHFHLVFALSALVRTLALLLIARWSARYELRPRTIRRSLVEGVQRMDVGYQWEELKRALGRMVRR
ncbi:MFS transporter [bacterium]|nr:MFS transporter [bacterium]